MFGQTPRSTRRRCRLLTLVPLLALLATVGSGLVGIVPAGAATGATYTNPLKPRIAGDGVVESCADPTVFKGRQAGDRYWYMFCTSDPLNDTDRNATGGLNFHNIPMMRSLDLVNWTYVGDAFSTMPAHADPGAHLWAPEVTYSSTYDTYYLFYVVTDVADGVSPIPGCHNDNAIGVATSRTPTGPWTAQLAPAVGPRSNGGGCDHFWTFDPDVLSDVITTASTLYYGSYYGGVWARPLSVTASGATTSSPETQITIANKYEGANVVQRGGYYYLFVSATNCCNGPLTGYSVFAGRSTSPLGPFVDREGVSLLAGRAGGTPALSMNGNKWVGPGHNSVFRDYSGQWWTVYHAVNRFDPYFAGEVGFTKRPALLDPVVWVNGWPTVRAGRWASAGAMPGPAAQPGWTTAYQPNPVAPDVQGALIASASDEFRASTVGYQWTWVRRPPAGTFAIEDNTLRFNTQAADLYVDNNSASVLKRPAPTGDYMVTTRVRLNVPAEGCCFNYVQAGLLIYGDDDNFIKLAHASIWETRQTEFAKEVSPVPTGYPRYGNTVIGPPGEWTYLRIVKRSVDPAKFGGDTETYTGYTSLDGTHWVRGGTWTHKLGSTAQIGLVSMGGSGFIANFDFVRVHRLG